jgi:hypothetical protein
MEVVMAKPLKVQIIERAKELIQDDGLVRDAARAGSEVPTPTGSLNRGIAPLLESKSKSWCLRTCANADTNSLLQASEMRAGTALANQFGSLPKLPTYTNSTPLIFRRALPFWISSMIFASSSLAGSAKRVVFFLRLRGTLSDHDNSIPASDYGPTLNRRR